MSRSDDLEIAFADIELGLALDMNCEVDVLELRL